MECEWCHDPVSEQAHRLITHGHPLANRFDDERFRIILGNWGRAPEVLCPKDFMVMLAKVNEDFFAAHSTP
jgi:hypothetical protein